MKPIEIPKDFNYIAVFLTFSCQLRCSYCINHHGGDLVKGRKMSEKDWINGLNRIRTRQDLPITLQGGEPTVHKYFYEIINGVKSSTSFDLLTNLEVDLTRFRKSLSPKRFRSGMPYASIRVSYHHGQSNFLELIHKVLALKEDGFSIGVFEVNHPDYERDVLSRQHTASALGIDWRIKEFLGPWKGKNYGTMRYEEAVNSSQIRNCMCKTSELLISPDGYIFRCHSDLYANRFPIGHLLDDNFDGDSLGRWVHCPVYGKCNSCDIKVKNDRFQQWGHSSVDIKDVSEPIAANDTKVVDVVNTYGKQ